MQFVTRDALAYIGLYLAICEGEWELRMACMKLMAPVFSAFERLTYRKLIGQHIADVLSWPEPVLKFFKEGGFVISLTGQPWNSHGVDEAHEMIINKACKASIVHPSREYINRVAAYLPHHSKCIENLKQQLFPEEHPSKKYSSPPSFISKSVMTEKVQRTLELLLPPLTPVDY